MLIEHFNQQEWIDYINNYSIKIAGTLAILILGWLATKIVVKILKKGMTTSRLDKTLVSFLSNIIHTLLIAFVFIAALDQLGVNTTSLAAILAAAGLAVGMALKDALSNFAAGVMVIILRQFKVGDFIEIGSTSGTVKSINIYNTTLTTGDNKTIIIPNSKLNSNNITNYSTQALRRIDYVIGVSYDDDIKKVKRLLTKIIQKDSRILKDPEPLIAVGELANSSVNFKVRPWVEKADYWDVLHDLNETIKTTFDKEGVSIPYPQQDVHIHKTNQS